MSDPDPFEALNIDADRPFPEKRSPDPIPENEDTLIAELATVTDRHKRLDPATVVRILFDFTESYANFNDVTRRVELRDAESADEPVPVVIIPDAKEPECSAAHLSVIGERGQEVLTGYE